MIDGVEALSAIVTAYRLPFPAVRSALQGVVIRIVQSTVALSWIVEMQIGAMKDCDWPRSCGRPRLIKIALKTKKAYSSDPCDTDFRFCWENETNQAVP